MSTLAQTTSNDLAFTNGQLTIVSGIADAAAIELRNKFLLVKGEWFLDTRIGVPYIAYVFRKRPDLLVIRQLFRKVILSVQGIKSVDELALEFDRAARRLSFTFRATADDGATITGGSGAPFIVEPT